MNLITRWQFVGILGLSVIPGGGTVQISQSSRAHVRNRRLAEMAMGNLRLTSSERKHLRACDVCQGVATVLINNHQRS